MNKNLIVLVLTMLLIGVTSGFTLFSSVPEEKTGIVLKADLPIRINNDSELANYATSHGWNGTGSEGDPYVVENYVIDVSTERSGIYLGNTTKHVIIKNDEIYNVSGALGGYGAGSGIALFNVSNVTITNVHVHESKQYGIYISSSSHILVQGNRIENNTLASSSYGIYVNSAGSDVVVKDNYLYNTNPHARGIYVYYSDYSRVINNTIVGFRDAGIDLHYTSQITVWDNSMYKCSINMAGNSVKHYTQEIPMNNTVNDNSVYYYLNQSLNHASISPTNPGEIILVNVSNAVVENLNISHTSVSYFVASSHNIRMVNTSAYDTGFFSFYFITSDNLTIENSYVIRSLSSAIYIYGVYDLHLSNVTVREASSNGIYLYYSYRLVFFNITLQNNYYGLSVYNSYYYKNQYTIIENSRFENMTQFLTKFTYTLNLRVNGSHFAYGTYAIWLNGFDDDAIITNNTIIHASSYGIYGSHSDNMVVDNNTIVGCDNLGIYMQYQKDARISYNYVEGGYGIEFQTVNSSVIMNNTIRDSEMYGISIYGGASHLGYTMIRGNAIYNSKFYGIYLNGTTGNLIYNNSLTGNNGTTGTYNPEQVQAWDDYPGNMWNTTHVGNYWADWTSPDSNGDGIVDNPYVIDGGAGAQDNKPLADSPYIPEFSGFWVLSILVVIGAIFLLRRR